MNELRYERAADSATATTLFAGSGHARYLGGGTNLVDLMRETIERPDLLVDVSGLDGHITLRDDGTLVIGAAATNTAVAAHRLVRERYPVLARAILAGASGQIRNMATVGGNLLQRTRCLYFFDAAARCNKRERGAGCDAVDGFNRMHAILGASPSCVATHPSDMCVALAALGARVHVQGASAARSIAMVDLHRLPGDTPDVETELAPGELITAIELPPLAFAANSTYRKVRDRASYAFALISVAAALDIDPSSGRIREARIALGGVAHKPWRAALAEESLRDQAPTTANFVRAAARELEPAVGLSLNTFKIELARRVIVATLHELSSTTEPRA